MKNQNEAVTHAVDLTYGLPSPLPKDWMERFGHLSLTVVRSERPPEKPGRMSIELSARPLSLNKNDLNKS